MTRTPHSSFRWFLGGAVAALALSQTPAPPRAQTAASATIADLDLTGPFHARSDWRLVATQGPQLVDPEYPDEPFPGEIELCLGKAANPCAEPLQPMPPAPRPSSDIYWQARYLNAARIVYPRGQAAAPLLLIQNAGAHSSGDGEQAVYTRVLAYRPKTDQFVQIYSRLTGHNNNQEVSFIASGPLRGDMISAEPNEHSPFGYWITVDRLTPAYSYSQVLRYRSATGYGDGNMLAVIDSEMPNIEKRLGLWRPGQPLPTPARCPKPHLQHMELWCS
jgi:hypothetical protein